ncbi:P-loop containing nucleoside triphosphate hydrolase protein [Mytilinidion resinicola]|uniref:Ribosome-releasing factor 2, mitochondrial n=1 Tax=Mytilinidion resinicola TaxID=574789 RepID=A0A6A6YJI4_9PEZI|nr:P-loop containing nucleoside triphosphate hydrolase protein [Mytilinidion resinicola]KAF2808950.1 P-loop containing nucleoside triphosphate hydrolase protein [Mytilinidion resinicola]
MLYYSGFTRRIGDVDEGSTVTDFLPAERARGITIQSAAITFNWPPLPDGRQSTPSQNGSSTAARSSISHNVNLIDTPGHADFTFEVLRSLRILDGAICILDGVAGVEAQTEKVWTQAEHYNIPRIIYVNKLDRYGAAFSKTVKEIGVRLHVWPALCQIPWWKDGKGNFTGVGDVVGLRGLLWEEGGDGKAIQSFSMEELETKDPSFATELKKARVALVEGLSEYDDIIVEQFLEYDEDHISIPSTQILDALRRCVLQSPQYIIPVFAGASFKNIGVQPLMDSVNSLLPSPEERPDPEISIGGLKGTLQQLLTGQLDLSLSTKDAQAQKKPQKSHQFALQNLQACALAFKVVNDPKRGVLVYVRVYSGSIDRNSSLFNTSLNVTEKAPRLLKMYASEAVEVESIPTGQIGVIIGLKYARTGDTLISYTGVNPKLGPPAPINTLQLRPINVPPPVFFTSVEPNSLSEEKLVHETLALLLREDPSLQLTMDEESGQTHLAGMGELHLEIARDRLINDFKAKARTGKIEIGYRETINVASESFQEEVTREIGGKFARASCSVSIAPLDQFPGESDRSSDNESAFDLENGNHVVIQHRALTRSGLPVSSDDIGLPDHLPFEVMLSAFQTGALAALSRGPEHGFPVASVQINISLNPSLHISQETTPAALSTVVRQAVRAALKDSVQKGGSILMEPVMMATITVNESSLGSVVHDISSARGGQVMSLDRDESTDSASDTSASNQDDVLIINSDRIYTPPDPFQGSDSALASADRQRQITARVPLKEMVGYLNHLRSLTGGRGTFVMTVDGFEKMNVQRQKSVLDAMRGDFV